MKESRGPVKRMGPQGSLLTTEHRYPESIVKKGLKEWGGENRRIKGSWLSP